MSTRVFRRFRIFAHILLKNTHVFPFRFRFVLFYFVGKASVYALNKNWENRKYTTTKRTTSSNTLVKVKKLFCYSPHFPIFCWAFFIFIYFCLSPALPHSPNRRSSTVLYSTAYSHPINISHPDAIYKDDFYFLENFLLIFLVFFLILFSVTTFLICLDLAILICLESRFWIHILIRNLQRQLSKISSMVSVGNRSM